MTYYSPQVLQHKFRVSPTTSGSLFRRLCRLSNAPTTTNMLVVATQQAYYKASMAELLSYKLDSNTVHVAAEPRENTHAHHLSLKLRLQNIGAKRMRRTIKEDICSKEIG